MLNTEKYKVEYRTIPVFTIKDFTFSYPLSKKTISIVGKIEIYEGERVLIKGPSGSGKSTLLLALSGIIPNEIIGKVNGDILFKGKQVTQIPPEKLHKSIGIVFQNPYSQRVTSSIEDELVFYLENLGYSSKEIDNRLKKLNKSLKLSSFINKLPYRLSGGELQKIILASVLIAEPEVLLFDEPTSYLDIKSEISFYRYLKENLEHQTVIIVDHKLNHNMNFIERIIELDSKGKIIFDGSKKDYKKKMAEKWINDQEKGWITKNSSILIKGTKKERLKLEIKNLNFAYEREKPLLKNIDLSIESGSVTSIFGLNGSGKTTLIKLASRLMKSNNSKITINGKENIKKHLFYNFVGVIFQNPETHFLFQTVEREITNGKIIKGISTIARSFNITDNIQQNPFTLSEGQKRRLNLANIFFLNKSIVFLDEPTFGQDEIGILNLIRTINILKRNGIGFLIVSHDTSFIRAISDKIFYLKYGKLRELKKIKNSQDRINEYN